MYTIVLFKNFITRISRFSTFLIWPASILFVACTATDQKLAHNRLIENLISYHVIEQNQQSMMEKYLEGGDGSPVDVIRALTKMRYDSFGVTDNMMYTVISFDTSGYGLGAVQTAIARVENFLEGLYKCSVVDEHQHRKYLAEIRSKRFTDPLQLLDILGYEVGYKQYMDRARLLSFADSLHGAGILLDKHYQTLKDDIQAGKLTLHYQLLDYLEHGAYFDLSQFPPDPEVYLPAIYGRIAKLLPELAFTDFHFTIVEDRESTTPDYRETSVIVSLKFNGVEYKHKSFISLPSGKEDGYLGYLDEQEFYQIFNRMLADRKVPYRLHHIPAELTFFPGNYQYFGILALTKEQQRVLDGKNSFFGMVSHESYEGVLSSDEIWEAIATFQQVGFTTHLTKARLDSAIERASLERPADIEHLLMCFPDVTYAFDMELANLENPYEEILDALSSISHGDFLPENIHDDFDIDKANGSVTFSVAGKTYTTDIKVNDDWMDPDFLTYVFDIAVTLKLSGKFYFLPGDGQIANLIYLTKPQVQLLTEKYGVRLE